MEKNMDLNWEGTRIEVMRGIESASEDKNR